MKKQAFTLAETLITLTILGVIAAMSVPALTKNVKSQELQTGVKVSYALLKEATMKYRSMNSVAITSKNTPNRKLKERLLTQFKMAVDCQMGYGGTYSETCVPNYNSFSDIKEEDRKKAYKTLNKKSDIDIHLFDDGQLVLDNGMIILIENNREKNAKGEPRLYISVDVNGYNKLPNRLGVDLFMFQIMPNGDLLPMGAVGTDYYSATDAYCSKTSSSNINGVGCTYKAIFDPDYFKGIY